MSTTPTDFSLPELDVPRMVANLCRDDARQWIDATEDSLHQMIVSLRTHRNAIASINQLPDELLLECFYNIFNDCDEDDISTQAGQHSEWMHCTRVCSRWRTLALGAHALWSNIDLGNSALSRLFLSRSRSAPVDVYFSHDCVPDRMLGFTGLLEPNLHRIRSLRFDVRGPSMDILLGMLDSPAPQLQKLCLSVYQRRRTSVAAKLVTSIFNDDAPLLREIYLNLVSIPWTIPIYRGLVHLELIEQHPSAVPSLADFLAMLSSSPDLHRLTLINAGPRLAADVSALPVPEGAPIELPRLAHLMVASKRVLDAAHLLTYVAIPPSAHIRMACGDAETATPRLRDCFPQDCTALRPLAAIADLEFRFETDMEVSLIGRKADNPQSNSLFLDVTPDGVDGATDPKQWFNELGQVFPMPLLSTLRVTNSEHSLQEEDWVAVLSRFPLRELELGYTARPTALLRALQRPGREVDVVCPQLSMLTLEGIVMDDETLPLVLECFRYRLSQGAPLQVLKLGVIAGMTGQVLEELETVVRSVEYDVIDELY